VRGDIVTDETEKLMQTFGKELVGEHGSRLARGAAVTLTVIGLSVVSVTGAFAAATTTTTPSPGAAIAAFRACMTKHGVKLAQRRPGAGGPPTSGSGGGTGGGRFGRAGGGFDPTKVPANLPKGVTAKKYLAAVKACKSKIPKGGFGFGGANRGQYQAYISCLRDHGVNIPQRGSATGGSATGGSGSGSSTTTTTGGSGGNGGGPLGRLDRNDPAFAAANQICAPLLPSQGAGATPTTGGAST
jgi:hypothetical protein